MQVRMTRMLIQQHGDKILVSSTKAYLVIDEILMEQTRDGIQLDSNV